MKDLFSPAAPAPGDDEERKDFLDSSPFTNEEFELLFDKKNC
jgi:hypothetical protein